MDDLNLSGGLGGAAAISLGYAKRPLAVGGLAVVSSQAFADIGLAITFDSIRFYANLTSPLTVQGDSGTAGGYLFAGPAVDIGSVPDLITDVRIGADARLFGEPGGTFRAGAGAQLIIPNGMRTDWDTDDTFRAMGRALFAGDVDGVAYASQIGIHFRALDEHRVPQAPAGQELLFGAAVGPKIDVGEGARFIVGPEVFGETALRSAFSGSRTGIEALVTGRFEAPSDLGGWFRLKLGAGAGLHARFGAPEWRVVVGFEIFTHDFGV
jgi:hypothetical protein